MARFLALDWDHKQLHVVAATISRGAVKIQQARVWTENHIPNPAQAEELGKRLREHLKEAGIAPAPVLACLGRDRVILRDIRYPAVPDSEEPAVVRFQAVKELTDPPDEVVIDYERVGNGNGERRALALIARRELVEAYQELCKAAGLKLAGLTPRPFGIARCLQRLAGTSVLTPAPEPADAPVAILAIGDRWAEFCVARGEELVFARSLTVGPTLAGEVRRNLAVYAGQAPQLPLKAVYIAGGSEHAPFRERLADLTGLPVYSFDPFAGVERPDLPLDGRGGFAGAVGLLHALATRNELPINFARPKEPRPQTDPNRRKLLLGGVLAAAALVAVIVFLWMQLDEVESAVAQQNAINSDYDTQLRQLDEDRRRIEALREWNDGTVNWLEETHDLTDRFPDTNEARLIQLSFDPLARPAKKQPKQRVYAGRITLRGIAQDRKPVDGLMAKFDQDGHYRVEPLQVRRNISIDRRNFPQEFSTKVEVEKIPSNQYARRLELPPEPDRRRAARDAGREE